MGDWQPVVPSRPATCGQRPSRHDGYWVPGFWRQRHFTGFVWLDGTYVAGAWVWGDWQPCAWPRPATCGSRATATSRATGCPASGGRGSPGLRVAGRRYERPVLDLGDWRPVYVPTGLVWVGGHRHPHGYWVAGYWRPAVRHGYHWVDGYWMGGRHVAAAGCMVPSRVTTYPCTTAHTRAATRLPWRSSHRQEPQPAPGGLRAARHVAVYNNAQHKVEYLSGQHAQVAQHQTATYLTCPPGSSKRVRGVMACSRRNPPTPPGPGALPHDGAGRAGGRHPGRAAAPGRAVRPAGTDGGRGRAAARRPPAVAAATGAAGGLPATRTEDRPEVQPAYDQQRAAEVSRGRAAAAQATAGEPSRGASGRRANAPVAATPPRGEATRDNRGERRAPSP